jgi:hypothetical protein
VFDSFINYMDKFGPEILVIQFGFLVILSTIFLWLWFSNRRKFNNLKHAIPANIVKSYLDSIIQNSTSLKSQLFRGGGLDVGGAIPSVIPLQNLMGGEGLAMSGAPSTALMEELNQKKAMIAALEAQLASAQLAQREFETKYANAQTSLANAEKKIKELEALLAQNRTGGGGDSALKNEIAMISKERDELRDRLKEFEIIADDLANLKRLQQENEQLKRSLGVQTGKPVVAAPLEEAPTKSAAADVSDLFEDLNQSGDSGDNKALEDFLSEPSSDEAAEEIPSEEPAATSDEDMMAALGGDGDSSDRPKSEKTPEDLLSEFEKMLG